MRKNNTLIQQRILSQPAYWTERINGYLYDAVVCYMEDHNMTQDALANYLALDTNQVTQLLDEGEINLSLDKMVNIVLKVDKLK